jgi:DNA-binding IclR family transcriptional regulator
LATDIDAAYLAGTKLMATKALANALRILQKFDSRRPEWGVAELARSTGMDKSHVSKIVREFVLEKYLIQDADSRRYQIGPRALTLGAGYLSASRFSRYGMRVIRDLVAQTGFTVTLNVVEDRSVLFVASVKGSTVADPSFSIGSYIPMHATAAGKISMAYLPAAAADLTDTTELPAITRASIRDPIVLRREIAEVRKRGYAKTCGESTPGVCGIAAPVHDQDSNYIGAISALLPLDLLRTRTELEFIDPVRVAARNLSRQLGSNVV